MKTLALYLRISNEDSSLGESASIQNQRRLLNNYVQNQPEFADWNVLEFQDDGWSGTTFDRPAIQKLLEMAGKEISCIIVKDFSRFGRNLIETGSFLDQVFPYLGVRFIAVNDGYDSSRNTGQTIGLDVSLRAMVYEMYSRDLSKKITSVKEGKMRKGQYTGSFSFFGYQRTDTTASGLMPDPKASAIVKRIFSLAAAGKRTKEIAIVLNQDGILPPLSYRRQKNPDEGYQCPVSGLNVWTQARVAAIIKDERYIGVLVSKKRRRSDILTKKSQPAEAENWIRAENAIEPIVTREEYENAQKIILSRSARHRVSGPTELFRGLLRCACCGKALEKVPGKTPCFRCATGRYYPELPCSGVIVDKLVLETAILTSLQAEVERMVNNKHIHNEEKREKTVSGKQGSGLDIAIKKCKTQSILLFEQYDAGQIDKMSFLAGKQAVARQIDAIKEEQEELKNEIQNRQEPSAAKMEVISSCASMQSLLREILPGLIKELRVWQDCRIEIFWSFCEMN